MNRPLVQMGQLSDIELCNNVLFLLHHSPESILSKSNDHFWCGLADAVTDNHDSALIRLEQVNRDDPTYLGALVLQVQLFKQASNREKSKKADSELKEARSQATAMELEFAAIAYYAQGRHTKAIEYLDKCMKKYGAELSTVCLRGAFEPDHAKSEHYFDQIPEEAHIGQALGKYFQLRSCLKARQHATVQRELESLIQINSQFTAGRILMCQTAFGIQEWEALFDAASWLISLCPKYYDAHMYVIIESLLSGQSTTSESGAQERLSYFISVLDKFDERNFARGTNYSRLLIGVVGDDAALAPLIAQILDRCPDNADRHYLRGRLHLLQGETEQATKCFNQSMSTDPSKSEAFCGLVWCLIKQGNRRRAQQQLEMAKSLMAGQVTAEINLLEVILDAGENKIELLKRAFNEQTKKLMNDAPDLKLLEQLDPLFCLDIIEQYIQLIDPSESSKSSSPVRRTDRLIGVLRRTCANLKPVRLVEARLRMLSGDLEEAEEILNQLHQAAPDSVDVYMLFAELEVKRQNGPAAQRWIEQARAIRFDIQGAASYQLIQARIGGITAHYGDAISAYEKALSSGDLAQNHQVQANIELAEAYRKNGQLGEAQRVTNEIETKYAKTSSIAGKLALSKAERCLQNNDVQAAINILAELGFDSDAAIKAKRRLAEIYLVERRNEEQFIALYEEMCHRRPGEAEQLIALGDALLRVNRAEDAIRSYEAALRLAGSNPALQIKIGRALIITHDYSGALKYYKKSLKRGENAQLRLELADLLRKLDKYDDAEVILLEGTEHSTREFGDIYEEANCYYQLCQMKAARGNKDEALQLLAQAKGAIDQLLKVNNEQEADNVKQLAADIHAMIAQLAQQGNDFDNAIKFYAKAASLVPHSAKCNQLRLKLAQAYRDKGDLQAAQGKWSYVENIYYMNNVQKRHTRTQIIGTCEARPHSVVDVDSHSPVPWSGS